MKEFIISVSDDEYEDFKNDNVKELIRCKDCAINGEEKCLRHYRYKDDEYYCADGVKKDD